MSKTLEVLEALPTLSLEEIDEQIGIVTTAREEATRDFDKKLAALSGLRSFVDLSQNGPPPKKTRAARGTRQQIVTSRAEVKAGADEEGPAVAGKPAVPVGGAGTYKQRSLVYLGSAGATKVATLADALGTTPPTIYGLLKDPSGYFEKDGINIRLTPAGRRAAGRL